MLVGLPKEIKNHEYRVGLTPASVHELSTRGHQVLVQRGAGADIGLSDARPSTAVPLVMTATMFPRVV